MKCDTVGRRRSLCGRSLGGRYPGVNVQPCARGKRKEQQQEQKEKKNPPNWLDSKVTGKRAVSLVFEDWIGLDPIRFSRENSRKLTRCCLLDALMREWWWWWSGGTVAS